MPCQNVDLYSDYTIPDISQRIVLEGVASMTVAVTGCGLCMQTNADTIRNGCKHPNKKLFFGFKLL